MNKINIYLCPLCDNAYIKYQGLKQHLKTHFTGFACPLCNKPYAMINKHLKHEHSDIYYLLGRKGSFKMLKERKKAIEKIKKTLIVGEIDEEGPFKCSHLKGA